MRLAGRLSGAIDVLQQILEHRNAASSALSDWGRSHRFAGSGDRAAIGNLVFDALRSKNSFAAQMDKDDARSLVLATAVNNWGITIDELAVVVEEQHGPGSLQDGEKKSLQTPLSLSSPDWVKGNYPQWLEAEFSQTFGDDAARQGAALAKRAPLDLRANLLKTTPEKLLQNLAKFNAVALPFAPWAVRINAPDSAGRLPNIEAEPLHGRGAFEIQDAGSQIVTMLCGAEGGHQVADICAGAGGKTLALSAMMGNKGQIHAHDNDKLRLRPIFDRLKRAGAHNIQVIAADEPERLDLLAEKLDLVVVDAPCSGSGAWRRKPDAKWRLSEKTLESRLADQVTVLDRAASLVKSGGRLCYITCSVLPIENTAQIDGFLQRHPEFSLQPYEDMWRKVSKQEPPKSADGATGGLLLTPASHDTDGFYIASLVKS